MKKLLSLIFITTLFFTGFAQVKTDAQIADPKNNKVKPGAVKPGFGSFKQAGAKGSGNTDTVFTIIKSIPATPVKDQAMTGTCWCFATTSFIESQCLKDNLGDFDLSEMFSVRNIYLEKAKQYVLRQGHTQFGEGGLGHDLINAIAKYGAVPETVYSGLIDSTLQHNHIKLEKELKEYLDSVIKKTPVAENWVDKYEKILDEELGDAPESFKYKGKEYTPITFANDVLKFNPNDYVYITSFTHHPYYEPFILEVPDNFSNGMYYNVPLEEMLQLTKEAINAGYSVVWDADVSNDGFQQRFGSAVNFNNLPAGLKQKGDLMAGVAKEGKVDAKERQRLFENLTTQDDHLMHITGLTKSKTGNNFFLVKNSWGNVGPSSGYINVSESYFQLNTISLVIPKAAINRKLLDKLHIK
ncbi:MAG: C1 family peptidase [Ferruginibacter sp.]